jgi:hypothetical protein
VSSVFIKVRVKESVSWDVTQRTSKWRQLVRTKLRTLLPEYTVSNPTRQFSLQRTHVLGIISRLNARLYPIQWIFWNPLKHFYVSFPYSLHSAVMKEIKDLNASPFHKESFTSTIVLCTVFLSLLTVLPLYCSEVSIMPLPPFVWTPGWVNHFPFALQEIAGTQIFLFKYFTNCISVPAVYCLLRILLCLLKPGDRILNYPACEERLFI